MKTLIVSAAVVFALAAMGGAYADNGGYAQGQPQPVTAGCPQPCPAPQPEAKCCPTAAKPVCPSCPNPAWDRTPIVVYPNARMGAGPAQIVTTDPWVSPCGAFCSSGQLSVGWPFGWTDEYWLRPNSNL